MEEKVRESSRVTGRAQLVEVCIESTFQPVLQWYLLYPSFLRGCMTGNFEHNLTDDKTSLLPYLSMLSSIISLAWSFTAHKAIYKDGALDLTVSPVSRVVLCASDLLLILSRLNFIILFMYYFGPGIFFPGVIFLIFHSLLMILLHMIFEKMQGTLICSNGFAEVCTEVHTCLLNGLANMFSNNGRINILLDTFKNQ